MSLFPAASRLEQITYEGKQIVLADYSGLKEAGMIELTNQHTALVVSQGSESYFIANYKGTYGSANYMKAAYAFTQATKPFIPKGAFLGITGAKIPLLKGVVYFLHVNFKSFESEEEALKFLIS